MKLTSVANFVSWGWFSASCVCVWVLFKWSSVLLTFVGGIFRNDTVLWVGDFVSLSGFEVFEGSNSVPIWVALFVCCDVCSCLADDSDLSWTPGERLPSGRLAELSTSILLFGVFVFSLFVLISCTEIDRFSGCEVFTEERVTSINEVRLPVAFCLRLSLRRSNGISSESLSSSMLSTLAGVFMGCLGRKSGSSSSAAIFAWKFNKISERLSLDSGSQVLSLFREFY